MAVDAVIIASPDHWTTAAHQHMVAGADLYVQKAMVQIVEYESRHRNLEAQQGK